MLARWNPYQETTPLREMMNRLFEQSVVPGFGWGSQAATQSMDVYTEGDNYVIETALPGLSPDAISVSVLANQVGISGEYPAPPEGRQYLLRERASGRFERTVTLPTEVDADKAEPNYEQGLLRLVFPKAEHAKPRRISLTGGQRQQEPAATAGRSS
jgi:HSP20 family protein